MGGARGGHDGVGAGCGEEELAVGEGLQEQ